ncbi:PAS domain-containing protein [Thermodesulfovibrio hydrogeniphilus]
MKESKDDSISRNLDELSKENAELRVYQSLFEASPIPICIFELKDDRLVLININSAAEEILGKDLTSCIGKLFEDICPFHSKYEILKVFVEAIKNKKSIKTTIEDFITNKEGLLNKAIEINAFSVSDNKLVVMFHDITQLKEMEKSMLQRNALFYSLFENAVFLAGVLDQEGRLIEVNQNALKIIGMPAEAVIGKPFINTP